MKRDLLREIEGCRDLTHVVILTHNIDFLFLETMVLPVIAQGGHPTITVFADAGCATEAFTRQERYLRGGSLGLRYRVVQVPMPQGGRFHPKAILLMGAHEGKLYVGSGNLTLGGWRENAEIWRYFSSQDGSGPMTAFRAYLQEIVASVPLHEDLASMVVNIFDGHAHLWFTPDELASHLVWHHQHGDVLLTRMAALADDLHVSRLHLCAPYFDGYGVAVKAVVKLWEADETHVYTQAHRTNLCATARTQFPTGTLLHGIQGMRPGEITPFVHAKFYACEHGEQATVFIGSANCSVAALLRESGGNSELLAMDEVPRQELHALLFRDLVIEGEPPLPEHPSEDDHRILMEGLAVHAARYHDGVLQVAYTPADANIASCLVDGVSLQFENIQPGIIEIRYVGLPRVVTLADRTGCITHPCWIDSESHLNSSAPQRALASSINHALRPENWGITAWTDVVGKLCKYIEYRRVMPIRRHDQDRGNDTPVTITFRATDVFVDTTHPFAFAAHGLARTADQHIYSLRGLLLSLFGYELDTPARKSLTGSTSAIAATVTPTEEGEAPDSPEVVVTPMAVPHRLQECSQRDKRLAKDLVIKLSDLLTNSDFLAQRSPELVGTDLSMAAMLLLEAHKRHWIDDTLYFEVTFEIWNALFLRKQEGGNAGWIAQQFSDKDERAVYLVRMRSPLLASSLLAWFLLTPEQDTYEYAQFVLAALLAIARHPVLWVPKDEAQRQVIQRQLEHLLADIGGVVEDDDHQARVDQLNMRHTRLFTLAEQFALADAMLLEDATCFPITDAQPGEIVYNVRLGYCLVLGRNPSNPEYHLATCLQDENGTPRKFQLQGFFYGAGQVLARADGISFSFTNTPEAMLVT
ncbi:MAG TPA: hypothetical protein VHV83_02300 [Armatimonadota bacterium]|nr:hypothetical protein [Armatimonadota bacterium]